MIPRILEYEDGRVKVTAEAYGLPELKAILDKYDMKAEPYLAYVAAMSAPDSPYIRIPIAERQESALYDIQTTMGEFDWEDPLVEPAIEKIRSMYVSAIVLMAEELEEEMHRWRKLLRDTPPSLTEESDAMRHRMTIMANIDKYAANVAKVREQADREISTKMKGKAEMGEY